MKKIYCKCDGHYSSDYTKFSNLYITNFIPTNFNLEYDKLVGENEKIYLLIEGKCKVCNGYMVTSTAIPYTSNIEVLIQRIWRTYNNHRPLCEYIGSEKRFRDDGMRYEFYTAFEKKGIDEKLIDFYKLFKDDDRLVVEKFSSFLKQCG